MSDAFTKKSSPSKKKPLEKEDAGEELISNKRLEKQEREGYKHSFLVKLLMEEGVTNE